MAYAEPLPQTLGRQRTEASRICSVTGLRIFTGAQALTVANAVAAVLALATGGLFGMLVGLSRAPALDFLGPNTFYAALTGHGVSALVLWPVFFEVAAMVFASSILLNARVWSMKLGWLSFALMTGGAAILLVTILLGEADVMFTAYPPLVATPAFYIGYLVFAVGVLGAIVNFTMTILAARVEGVYSGSLPLVTYGVACAAILALISLLSGLIALVPAWFYSQGWIDSIEPIVYRGWFWGLGHTLQYVNVIAMVVAWYGIAALGFGAGPVNQKFTRFAFVLYLLIAVPVLGHHFLVDPSLGTGVKFVGGTVLGFGLGIPSLMHGLAVMGGIEAEQRARGVAGLFGWLKRLKWGHFGTAALACSLLIFAIGGWSGTVETTLPLNLVNHNTMGVPAHLHSTVVGGTTIAFMGFAYFLVPLLTRRRLWGGKLATIQVYMYGAGLFVMIVGQTWAGAVGVPRRTSSIAYEGGVPGGWHASMNLNGVGVAFASTAGALFILIMVATLLIGKRTTEPTELAEPAYR